MRLRMRKPDSGSDTLLNCAVRRGLHLEHRRRGDHILRHAVFNRGDRDRGLQVGAGPQQLEAKRQFLAAPDAGVGVEANAAVLLRAQFVEAGGQTIALRGVRRGCAALGIRQQGIEGERIGGGRRVGSRWVLGAHVDHGECEREYQH